jgi:hypothetical protein
MNIFSTMSANGTKRTCSDAWRTAHQVPERSVLSIPLGVKEIDAAGYQIGRVWQDYDMAPDFPKLVSWTANLEGPLYRGQGAVHTWHEADVRRCRYACPLLTDAVEKLSDDQRAG